MIAAPRALLGGLLSCVVLLAACAPAPEPHTPAVPRQARGIAPSTGSNVLLVIIDDLGVDQVAAYGQHPNQPPTPTLSTLASEGMRFDRFYAFPTCSPARAALLTGRLPNRVGIGGWIEPPLDYFDLPLAEVTIPEMLDQGTQHSYATALFGKWHLATHRYPDYGHHALDQGFDWWQGSPDNLGGALIPDGEKNNYSHWEKSTNGHLAYTDVYATTAVVDDALAKIPELPEPWFAVVSFNAPHIPMHYPPSHLHTQYLPQGDCSLDTQTCWVAMVEAMDTELGRLITGLGPALMARTHTMVTSDNGTAAERIPPPFNPMRSKGTLFDGGVRVPMIVTGPHVRSAGTVSHALTNLVDVFPTVAQIAGIDLQQVRPVPGAPPIHVDGQSMLPLFDDPSASAGRFQFSQKFAPNGPTDQLTLEITMARSDTHKLIRTVGEPAQLYRYESGALDEGADLFGPDGSATPGDLAAYHELDRLLDAIVARAPYEGP